MAAKKTTTQTNSTPAPTTTNKSDAIRAIAKANPEAKPKDIVALLAAQGVTVGTAHVASVLKPKAPKIDTATVTLAAAFVKGFDGMIDEAGAMIEKVGEFVIKCGGPAKALAALNTYRELISLVK